MKAQALVSYSYYEKDDGQKENLDFFILRGMGISEQGAMLPQATDFSIVVSGEHCAPCHSFNSLVREHEVAVEGVAAAWSSQRLTVLHRSVNMGMDFAAHNVRTKHPLKTHCIARNSDSNVLLNLSCIHYSNFYIPLTMRLGRSESLSLAPNLNICTVSVLLRASLASCVAIRPAGDHRTFS